MSDSLGGFMRTVTRSKSGIDFIATILCEKAQVVTRAVFWRIPHATRDPEINLKIGRYKKSGFNSETLIATAPKSELTLNDEELTKLLDFVGENHAPFKSGANTFISLEKGLSPETVGHLKSLFRNPDKQHLIAFLAENDILPEDLVADMEARRRRDAVREFEELLASDALESRWQTWFQKNDWVLGSEFVRILDSRDIDTDHVSDYLVQAYDGFLDVIEIKRPGGGLQFWAGALDHGNYVPSTDLVKAITQASSYLFELEREINSQKFLERMDGVQAVKPRCVLVFGRSAGWSTEQCRAYRILNAGYHNISILTYDHVLQRAKRMVGDGDAPAILPDDEDEIPF